MLYNMNNQAAFDLGAFNYPCLYDLAIWIPNKDHRYFYVRGRMRSYSVGINKDGNISVRYANSIRSRNRFVKWISEIIVDKFGHNKTWSIETDDGLNTYPYTPSLLIKGNQKIMNYCWEGDKTAEGTL